MNKYSYWVISLFISLVILDLLLFRRNLLNSYLYLLCFGYWLSLFFNLFLGLGFYLLFDILFCILLSIPIGFRRSLLFNGLFALFLLNFFIIGFRCFYLIRSNSFFGFCIRLFFVLFSGLLFNGFLWLFSLFLGLFFNFLSNLLFILFFINF